MTKQPRLKLPKYLDAVRNHVTNCVKCGATEGLDVAHYSGLYANRLGKGTGSKCHDYAVARLCRGCHNKMDNYASGNSDERAVDFLIQICRTMCILEKSKKDAIPVPKDLVKITWLYRVYFGLLLSINKKDDATEAIDWLSNQRNSIARASK